MYWILGFFVSCSFLYATTLSDFIAIDSSLQRAQMGVSVIDVNTGKQVFGYNSNKNMLPASLMKIPLAAAVYAKFGPEHKFETRLSYTGRVSEDGVLHGDVIIEGGGDPTLNSSILDEWVQSLTKMGISSVEGQVVADASCFESMLSSPSWEFEDLSSYYAGIASGLSIDGNTYEVVIKGGQKEGDPSVIEQVGKAVPGLLLFNEVTTGGDLPNSTVFGVEYSPLQIFRGSVPANMQYSMRGTLPDPARYTGELLRRRLSMSNDVKTIRKRGEVAGKMLLHSHKSPKVSEIVKTMCHESNNLYAQHLVKHLGGGYEKEGVKYEKKYLKELGLSMHVADGPGISRQNYGSANAFAKLIQQMRADGNTRLIVDTFPEMGVSGALRSMELVPGARVLGKTGILRSVTNLCGVVQLDTGKEYAFAFLVNNHEASNKTVREFIRRFIEELVKELR